MIVRGHSLSINGYWLDAVGLETFLDSKVKWRFGEKRVFKVSERQIQLKVGE